MHLTTPQLQNALNSIIATHESNFIRYKTDVEQRYNEELQKNQMQALEQIKNTLEVLEEHGSLNELVSRAKLAETQKKLFA